MSRILLGIEEGVDGGLLSRILESVHCYGWRRGGVELTMSQFAESNINLFTDSAQINKPGFGPEIANPSDSTSHFLYHGLPKNHIGGRDIIIYSSRFHNANPNYAARRILAY
jgi:hypothetical protein